MTNNATNPKATVDAAFNLKGLLEQLVDSRGEHTCLVFEDRAVSFRELHNASNRLANFIQNQGLKPGSRVGIISKNSNLFYEMLFACAKSIS